MAAPVATRGALPRRRLLTGAGAARAGRLRDHVPSEVVLVSGLAWALILGAQVAVHPTWLPAAFAGGRGERRLP